VSFFFAPTNCAASPKAIFSTSKTSTNGRISIPSWLDLVLPYHFTCYHHCFVVFISLYLTIRLLRHLLDRSCCRGTPRSVGCPVDWIRVDPGSCWIQSRIFQQLGYQLVLGHRIPGRSWTLPVGRLPLQRRVRHRVRIQNLQLNIF
jgi:hypothetical protein